MALEPDVLCFKLILRRAREARASKRRREIQQSQDSICGETDYFMNRTVIEARNQTSMVNE